MTIVAVQRKMISVKKAARILGYEPQTLYKWKYLKKHLQIFRKVGGGLRIDVEALEQMIEDGRIEPSAA